MFDSLADYLWIHMGGLYGHQWTSAYGDDPGGTAGAEWYLTLQDLTREQIDAGLYVCRRSGDDWPPAAPAFRARCFGIPSYERVKADLHSREMPFTRMVWESIDHWLLSQSNARDADRMVRNAYNYATARRLDGAELPPEPAGALEHKPEPFKPCSAEARARAPSGQWGSGAEA